MNLLKANKQQLIAIALDEECSLSLRYKACRELQGDKEWQGWQITDLVRYYPLYTEEELMQKLKKRITHIRAKAERLGLRKAIEGEIA